MLMFPPKKDKLTDNRLRMAFSESLAEAKLLQSRQICYSAAALKPLTAARKTNKQLVKINKELQRKVDRLEHELQERHPYLLAKIAVLELKLRHAKEEAMKMKELPDLVKLKGEYVEFNENIPGQLRALKKEEITSRPTADRPPPPGPAGGQLSSA